MKRLAILFVILLCFTVFPLAGIKADSLIENSNFEAEILSWSQGNITEITPYHGKKCFALSAPVYNADGTTVHSTQYNRSVSLSGGCVYSLRFFIRTDFSDNMYLPDCQVFMPIDEKKINFRVSNISTIWKEVNIKFMVNTTGAYTLSFDAVANAQNSTIYFDEVQLIQVNFSPRATCIQGRKNVLIPEAGSASYIYTAAAIDDSYSAVTVQNCLITTERTLPNGVTFDSQTGILHVEHTAVPDTEITLFCVPYSDITTPITSIKVVLSKNIVTNSGFDDFPLYSAWDNDTASMALISESSDSFYAKILNFEQTESGYISFLTPAESVFLYANHLYVCRTNVRSDAPYLTRRATAQAYPPDTENTIHVTISDIGGTDWSEVITSFQVPADGIYMFSFDFITPDNRPVYVDSISIKPESLLPSSIQFNAPLHISIPKTESLFYPIAHAVFDQTNQLCDEEVCFSVSPENQGVSIQEQNIVVLPTAKEAEYMLSASLISNPQVKVDRCIQITEDSVGDGSFEYPTPGMHWTTALPSTLHFVSAYNGYYPSSGNLFARLAMNGPVSVVMSDSVYQYSRNSSYVFEANVHKIVPDIETVVTVLVDNIYSESFDDNLVIGQFMLDTAPERIQLLFSPSESVTGRIMIAFNTPLTHDQQIILMDDITVSSAKVYASNVRISGLPYMNKTISGKYRFTSSFNAVDASTYRWLISDSEDGIYMPISNETEIMLSITAEMQNKYIKFEITPISLSGPVVGESVSTQPIRIGEPIPSDNDISTDLPAVEPFPTSPSNSEKPTLTAQGMKVLDIKNYIPSHKQYFFDLENHWAKNEIELLTAANVLEGRGNGLFAPEESITRAEFSAILARAFELAPIYYEDQFKDVKKHEWYAGAVAVITKYGFANGTSDSTFSPNLPITREEMASMIMRAYRKSNAAVMGSTMTFADSSDISNWAAQDISESCALGILSGLPNANFYPKKSATRAEAAVAIKRMLVAIADNLGAN